MKLHLAQEVETGDTLLAQSYLQGAAAHHHTIINDGVIPIDINDQCRFPLPPSEGFQNIMVRGSQILSPPSTHLLAIGQRSPVRHETTCGLRGAVSIISPVATFYLWLFLCESTCLCALPKALPEIGVGVREGRFVETAAAYLVRAVGAVRTRDYLVQQ